MSRKHSGFYDTIEYIGPRPQKPKRPNIFGGWVILVIALGIGFWFGRPMLSSLMAAGEKPSIEQAEMLISSLRESNQPGATLAAAALGRSRDQITYDADYRRIEYPGGDVAPDRGYAPDVVIRSLRDIGIDLQQEVHDDMAADFRRYPDLWDAKEPDPNIDHRRVANLQRFFERKAQVLTPSREAADYEFGDIVVWSLATAEKHIGIVVPGPGTRADEPWVVHMPDEKGMKWENILFDFKIEGHFRYPSEATE